MKTLFTVILLFGIIAFVLDAGAQTPEFTSISILNDNRLMPTDAVIDDSGNTFVIGRFSGDPDFDPSESVINGNDPFDWKTADSYLDAFIAKYNSDGSLAWVRVMWTRGPAVYQSTEHDPLLFFRDLALDASGNIYLVGDIRGIADGIGMGDQVTGSIVANGYYSRAFVKGFSTNGALFFDAHNLEQALSASSTGEGIAVDDSGNVYITGEFTNKMNDFTVANISQRQTYFTKFNSSGTRVAQGYPIVSAESTYAADQDNGGKAIAVDDSGNIIIAGYYEQNASFDGGSTTINSSNSSDVYIAYYNSSKVYQGIITSTLAQNPNDIQLDGSGNLYLNVATNLIKYNSSRVEQWNRNFSYNHEFSINVSDDLIVTRSDGELRFLKLTSANEITFEVTPPHITGSQSEIETLRAAEYATDNYTWAIHDITVTNFDDDISDGYEMGEGIIVASYEVMSVLDETPPAVSSTSPDDGATGVSVDLGSFVWHMSEEVKLGDDPGTTGVDQFIELHEGTSAGTSVAFVKRFNFSTDIVIDGDQVTLNNIPTLKYNTGYWVRYFMLGKAAIVDLSGNALPNYNGSGVFNFTTEAEADDTAPTLTSAGAIEGGSYDNNTLNFTLTFSEDVNFNTATNMFKIVRELNSFAINLSPSVSAITSSSISFEYKYVTNGESYHILIDPSAVSDLAGNSFAGVTSDSDLSFDVSWNGPEVITYSPERGEKQVPIGSNLVLTFDQDIALNTDVLGNLIEIKKYGSLITTVESFEGTSDRISIQNGNQLVIDPTDDLEFDVNYYFVTISSLAIGSETDPGKTASAFNSTSSWSFYTEFNYWDGSQWVDGTPVSTDNVAFKGDYPFSEGEVLEFREVYLHPGVTLSIENNGSLQHNFYLKSYGEIILESGSSLNSQNLYLPYDGASLTVRRNTSGGIGDGKYSFIGSPFNAYDYTTITGDHKYRYIQSNNTYLDASSLTYMQSGVGYTIANNDVLEFVGQYPGIGNVSTNISNSGEGFGYILVSNPYPTAISYEALVSAEGPGGSGDITSTIYIWDDGSGPGPKNQSDFITVNALGSVSGGSGRSADFNGYIGVAQGFFVESVPASTTLTFTNAMKANGNNADANYFRSDKEAHETAKIALVDKDEVRSEILIGWVNDADPGYDYKYDSRKLIGNEASQLYMPLENKQLAIQGVPEAYDKSIDLAIDIKEAGEYAFDMVELNSSRQLSLYDRKMDVYHDLSSGSYEFYTSKGVDKDRFEIFSSSRVLQEELDFNQIYAADNFLHIQMKDSAEVDVLVYALDGQVVLKTKTKGSDIIDMNSYSKGVYVVSAGDQSQKIIIK